tara:strand:+ start:784 stop:963 length:180 start_codon:yes stop_codon:yes gene_type:complete
MVRNGIMNLVIGTWVCIKRKLEKRKMIKKFKERFEFWSLYYRQEIIWFIVGFVIGAILL